MSEVIYLTENGLPVLMASSLETPYKEVGGFLIGKNEKRFIDGKRRACLTIDSVYPVMTSESDKNSWNPGNLAAYNRIIDTINVLGLDIVGEYHSHINGLAALSKEDKEYVREEVKNFKKKGMKIKNWIEIVANINEKEYENKQTKKSSYKRLKKKIKYNLKGIKNSYTGYEIIIATYALSVNDLTFQEVMVHIP